MIEFWITDNGKELFRQSLGDRLYQLGRASNNDLTVVSPHISRVHLQIDINRSQIMLTDLGSTNGFAVNQQPMPPHRAITVSADDDVMIGPLRLHFQIETERVEPVSSFQDAPSPSNLLPVSHSGITVYCSQAQPTQIDLRTGSLTVGRGIHCDLRLPLPDIAEQHATIRMMGGQPEIIALSDSPAVTLNGVKIPISQPTAWQNNQSLLIGNAGFVYTPILTTSHRRQDHDQEERKRWLFTAGGIGLIGLLAICVIGAAIFAFIRLGDDGDTSVVEENNGLATPTLAPTRENEIVVTSSSGIVEIVTVTPPPIPEDCEPVEVAQTTGFLDLPFPYRGIEPNAGGTADDFRRISQRTRSGGRINSFFDHEYPVYPPAFGGLEPSGTGIDNTMVLFDGTRSDDAFAQDAVDGDWYSGHAGIDYAPVNPLRADTPILAAAAGRIHLVTRYSDGNLAVWLTHDPDGDGTYQYATLYFHLAPDDYWTSILSRYNNAVENGDTLTVAQGERIGTMGTTGRSTGIHLHFEVRHDVNPPFGIYDRFEKVDPYGFFPSDISEDPWAQPVTWTDTNNQEREHTGVVSDYLWIHPLVEIDAADADLGCVVDVRVGADILGIIGFVVIDPGFTIAIRDVNGNIVAQGDPQTRRLTIRAEELEGVNLETVSLEYFDPTVGRDGNWVTVSGSDFLTQNANGDYTYEAIVTRSGQYILSAEQDFDFVPPQTRFQLVGNSVTGAYNTFVGSVEVSLRAIDEGLPVPSGVDEGGIQYSLDCGANWNPYTGPFTLTNADMGKCGVGISDEGIQLGEDELLVLAISTDRNGNVEQPASQVFVSVQP